ncbi:hypothetical protein MAN88_17020 [Microcystis aeruginosa]|nr:hypothetical protein MAN88_17020 [Microcystis aeruginosa]
MLDPLIMSSMYEVGGHKFAIYPLFWEDLEFTVGANNSLETLL